MSPLKPLAIVTGGAGFIGSHMVDLFLNEGYRVHVVDSLVGGRLQNLDHQKGNPDLRVDTRDIREIKPGDALFTDAKYVIHFAGIGDIVPSIDRPTDYMSANVLGTVCALEAARAAKVSKFVYAASSSCYGLAKELPTTEQAPIHCEYPYALSKYQGEQAVLHWGRVYHLPVNVIRIFNAYGTRSKTTGAYGAVFGVFLAQKLKGKPLTIVGDGTQRRDFLYVTDVARAFYLAATTPTVNEIYNLGAGNPQPVNRLVELLGGEKIHLPKRPGEPDCTWADIAKIQRDLGWKQEVSFEEGVRRMLAVIDYWREAPVWVPASTRKGHQKLVQFLGRENLMTGLTNSEKDMFKRKIKTREELRAIIGPRPRVKKVIMCHGTFDLVHPGHIRHLIYAKSKADILVTSLTTDQHISKANFRPFVPEALRAMNLAALEIVDYVVIRRKPDAHRESQVHSAGLFRQGL